MSDSAEHAPAPNLYRWRAPFMPWFEGDFSGSFNVRKMQPLARLMYRSLLAQAWHSDNPPYLPNNDLDLKLMADAPTDEDWQAHKQIILARFQKTADGKWLYHPKALREYERAVRAHERKVEAGKRRAYVQGQLQHNSSIAEGADQHASSPAAPELVSPAQPCLAPTTTTRTTTTTTSTTRASEKETFNSTEVAQIVCAENGWSGTELIWAFKAAIEFQSTRMAGKRLDEVAEWLVNAYREHRRDKGHFAVGPQKFFSEGRYQSLATATSRTDIFEDNPATRALKQLEAE